MIAVDLAAIVEKHRKWLAGEPGGERADLRSANLRSADLRSANLSSADLRSANLRSANLSSADLRSADLRSANLRSANLSSADLSSADLRSANLRSANLSSADLSSADLRSANLSSADLRDTRDDIRAVLDAAPLEVSGLLAALDAGRIDGSVYEGDCACLVGTIANLRGCKYTTLTNGLAPNFGRPAERWFLGIGRGSTADNNAVAALTREWILEWQAERGEGELIVEVQP